MTEKRQPWMKFYPADWRADPRLRMVSMTARGLWIDLLALMHEAAPYGHLLVNGKAPDAKQLASLVGARAGEVQSALNDLEGAGVFSRTENGTIYSRRMVRDRERAEEGRRSVERRWSKPNKGTDGQPITDPITDPTGEPIRSPITQRPDARSQRLESEDHDYAFAGQVIRLRRPDYDRWAKAYKNIPSLDALLQSRDTWLSTQAPIEQVDRWFLSTSNWLANKDSEYAAAARSPPKQTRITPLGVGG